MRINNKMRYIFQHIVFIATVALLSATVTASPEDPKSERDKNAEQVAKAWVVSLMQGETAVTTSLSATPFAFDKKQQIKTLSELRVLYEQIVEKKGKRDPKLTSVKIKTSTPESVEVLVTIQGEGMVIAIKPGEAFRVVGFWD